MTLRALTWNLWWRFGPWAERLPAITATLREQAPDLVCLQEVWASADEDQVEVLAAELDLHLARTDGPWHEGLSFGNAVLSRWPIAEVLDVTLPGPHGEPGHRRALVAMVDSPWGRWPVVSTHLDHRFDASATRLAQVAALATLVADIRGEPNEALPVLLGGDLNAVPDSDEIRCLTGRSGPPVPGLVLTDVWEVAGDERDGAGHTWRRDNPYLVDTAWPSRRLDYLMVSWPRPKPIGNPARAWLAGVEPVDGVVPSDHAAVVADLVTPD